MRFFFGLAVKLSENKPEKPEKDGFVSSVKVYDFIGVSATLSSYEIPLKSIILFHMKQNDQTKIIGSNKMPDKTNKMPDRMPIE